MAFARTSLREPPDKKFWNLIYSFLGWLQSDLVRRLEKFFFLRILWALNTQKSNMVAMLGLFLAHKIRNQLNRLTKSVDIHPRQLETKFQDFWSGCSIKKVHNSHFRVSQF